ncbi:Glycosyltransferase AglE [uncultured archaeon]|nr:Glycosyltransferase AglE [uncultured archaeon]
MAPLATVVIPVLNEEKYLPLCLKSLGAQTVGKENIEVIVVDSGSTDKTVDVAQEWGARVIMGEKSIPLNRQKGTDAASTEIVLSTDADCIHPPDWIERMLKHLADEKVLAVSGPTKPIPEESIWLDKACYFIGNLTLLLLHRLFKKSWFRGSNSAYRKQAIKKAGGYNLTLKAREDSDLSSRIDKLGKTKFDWNIVVYTSMRRRKNQGWLKTLRYYVDTPIHLITGKVYYKKAEDKE